jgi:hypothetical protein
MNAIVIVFLSCRDFVHSDFVPKGQTVNQELLLTYLGRLPIAV